LSEGKKFFKKMLWGTAVGAKSNLFAVPDGRRTAAPTAHTPEMNKINMQNLLRNEVKGPNPPVYLNKNNVENENYLLEAGSGPV
jgi:hypothetical protein